jgi:tellurite methyltransferase
MRVLDAGCGTGRNLVYFLREGYEVFAVDQSAQAISHVRRLAATLAPQLPAENFRVEAVEKMSWESAPADRASHDELGFDVVISSALLHFARDEEHWHAMVNEMWRVLKTGGILFARLASTIGLEKQVELIEGRRYHLPDGSDRFLVDETMLRNVSVSLGGEFIEPIKTTIVENLRAMTTWVLIKR